MKIQKIAVVTNYNIPDKLSAAIAVCDKLCTHINEIFVPENYMDRIFSCKCIVKSMEEIIREEKNINSFIIIISCCSFIICIYIHI